MSKRDEFITFVNELKAASPSISPEQYRGILRRAHNRYELSVDEASDILKDLDLNVGRADDYFEILGLSIEELESLNADAIVSRVMDAHDQAYKASLNAGGRPRSDGRTEDQWRLLLNEARDTLKDAQKREAYVAELQREQDALFLEEAPPIFKFPNGDEALNIPQLAILMQKHPKDSTDALYRGYLEQSLGRAGEMHFADAARSVVSQFSENRELGLKAMMSILEKKMRFQEGDDARTPGQLAHAIDLNWEQAKNLLFNGFIGLWLAYNKQAELASVARNITNLYRDEQNIGVEKLVQSLNPQIGHPKLHISHEAINFGNVDTETQQTIQLEIKNVGRGFVYGTLQLTNDIPGIQVSTTTLRGDTRFTLELDASLMASKKMYKTELVVNTNTGGLTGAPSQSIIRAESESAPNTNVGGLSGDIRIPISCYVDYPIRKSIGRVAISGAAVAVIALAACLIILRLGDAGWFAPRLTNANFVTLDPDWVKWSDKWLWTNWTIYKLGTPGIGFRFIVGLAALLGGVFAYRFFFFKRKGEP